MERYSYKIKGISPLLVHRNPMVDEDDEPVTGGKRGDDRFPPETWKSYLYFEAPSNLDGKTALVIPSANISASLEIAGKKIKGSGRSNLKVAAAAGIFFADVYPALLVDGRPIFASSIEQIAGSFGEHCKQAKELGFDLDVRPVSIGTAKHVRVRPRFFNWSIEGEFHVGHPDLDKQPKRVIELFKIAGLTSGLCDWRPASPRRPGPFGRYKTEVNYIDEM